MYVLPILPSFYAFARRRRFCNVRIEFLAPLHHNNFVALEVQCVLNFHMVSYVQELPFYTPHLCRLLSCPGEDAEEAKEKEEEEAKAEAY